MARNKAGGMRHSAERILDLVKSAEALSFRFIIGHPITDSWGIQRVVPPFVPGGEAKLEFYIGNAAWADFLDNYVNIARDGPALMERLDIQFYHPPEEEQANAEQQGG